MKICADRHDADCIAVGERRACVPIASTRSPPRPASSCERPGIHSEFRTGGGRNGLTSPTHTKSQSPQTQFLFGGLIEVFRDSDTGQLAMIPFSDLQKAVSAEGRGQRAQIVFVELCAEQAAEGHQDAEPGRQGQGDVQPGRLQIHGAGRQGDHQERGRRDAGCSSPRSTRPICRRSSPGATTKAQARNR